jgi:phytoene synthase
MPPISIPTLAEVAPAMAACRAALREGSYTFFAASLLLPRDVRGPASVLYAFCRMADDAVDQGSDKAAAVAMLRARLAALEADPMPQDRALAAVMSHFGIPRAVPEALLEGFHWDAQERRYESLEDLHGYAARVAGTVGAMMALVMGTREPRAVARAVELGIAMQLSNIARDVGEDARAGRLYLPLQWLREAGIDPDAWLARPDFSPALAGVIQRLLEEADLLYDRAGAGVARLPLACRPGINAARLLYAAIGHEVRENGFDSVTVRAVVPRVRKARLLVQAATGLLPSDAALDQPAVPAGRFLVDAVAAHALPVRAASGTPWWQVGHRVGERAEWTLDLFERLARQDQLADLGRGGVR